MNEYKGCIDNQSVEQKSKNYNFNEVCLSPAIVDWKEKTDWNRYPIRNQTSSCQCVTMTLATEMGIIAKQKYGEFLDFSSSFPYQQRYNKDLMGCSSVDIYSVFPKLGNVFESIMMSQNLSESQAMSVPLKEYYKELAKAFKIGRIELPIDFETVASTIQSTGKGVMLWFKFNYAEWTNEPFVSDQPTTSGHSVTAVDFLLKNGKKYLVIQDSWGLQYAINGYRLISEEYFKARCFLASYLKTFDNTPAQSVRPKYDGSIKSAQDCLKWEGLFPNNIESTGVYGNITKQAVILFQKRFNITPASGVLGPKTKSKLEELFK